MLHAAATPALLPYAAAAAAFHAAAADAFTMPLDRCRCHAAAHAMRLRFSRYFYYAPLRRYCFLRRLRYYYAMLFRLIMLLTAPARHARRRLLLLIAAAAAPERCRRCHICHERHDAARLRVCLLSPRRARCLPESFDADARIAHARITSCCRSAMMLMMFDAQAFTLRSYAETMSAADCCRAATPVIRAAAL